MVTLFAALTVMYLAILTVLTAILLQMRKRNQHLELEVEDRDRQAFHDLQAMFRYQELLDNKDIYIGALLRDLEGRDRVIEMLVKNEMKTNENFEASLRLVLDGR